MRPFLAFLCVLAAPVIGFTEDTAPEPEPSNPDLGSFFDNPFEETERSQRDEAYRQFFEEELADSGFTQNSLMRQVFAPRVTDELFDTNLPGVRSSGQWSITLSPRFSDFYNRDHIRFPFGVRYNTSRNFEIYTNFGGYFQNPFKDGESAGLFNWRFGGKYSWMEVADSRYNLALGFNADMPLMSPPIELTDGFARYEPYVAVSRQLREHPHWLVYLNLTYQFIEETPFRADPIQPQPRDQLFVRPGFIFYPGGSFRYSVELEYRTNTFDFREQEPIPLMGIEDRPPGFSYSNWVLAFQDVHEVILRPSVTWFPKKEIREGIFIPGNWDVGLQLRIPVIEETGQKFGVSVRFRWFYDYRKLLMQDIPGLFSRSSE